MAFGTVAHAELDAEIDAEPDEQHEERHRDQVERADQEQAPCHGDRQADRDADRDREDDAERSQRQPQDEEDRQQRCGGIEAGVLLEGAEFVVVDRDQAGLAHPRPIVLGEVQIRGGPGDRIGRRQSGLQRAEVEHRLDLDESPQLARLRRLAAGQHAPGKARRAVGHNVFDRIGGKRHRSRHALVACGLDDRA